MNLFKYHTRIIYLVIFLFVRYEVIYSQEKSIEFYKQKFEKYLNLNHQLDNLISFYEDKIVLKNRAGEEELTIYKVEIPTISKMLESEKLDVLEHFFLNKKNQLIPKRARDSILITIDEIYSYNKKNNLPLSGIRIAIDPGHFASDIHTAKVEQRLLYFTHFNNGKIDTIQLIEGKLTYLTAQILADKLQEQGAEILVTRTYSYSTAFGVSFNDWMKKRKKQVLDSLLSNKVLSVEKYNKLKSCTNQQFFNLFFREYELLRRAEMINSFNPHLAVIIHYNVDEKNNPWKKASTHNYSMCFIGGAFEDTDLDKMSNKIHFLRLLLTNQIENSEKISQMTIQHFEDKLSVNAARSTDALYLQKVCLPTSKTGVYCRNLLLTKYIISPLVYGESMCQDNYKECQLLSKDDYVYKGKKIPYRIYEVADAYFHAIMKYFNEVSNQYHTSTSKN